MVRANVLDCWAGRVHSLQRADKIIVQEYLASQEALGAEIAGWLPMTVGDDPYEESAEGQDPPEADLSNLIEAANLI